LPCTETDVHDNDDEDEDEEEDAEDDEGEEDEEDEEEDEDGGALGTAMTAGISWAIRSSSKRFFPSSSPSTWIFRLSFGIDCPRVDQKSLRVILL